MPFFSFFRKNKKQLTAISLDDALRQIEKKLNKLNKVAIHFIEQQINKIQDPSDQSNQKKDEFIEQTNRLINEIVATFFVNNYYYRKISTLMTRAKQNNWSAQELYIGVKTLLIDCSFLCTTENFPIQRDINYTNIKIIILKVLQAMAESLEDYQNHPFYTKNLSAEFIQAHPVNFVINIQEQDIKLSQDTEIHPNKIARNFVKNLNNIISSISDQIPDQISDTAPTTLSH